MTVAYLITKTDGRPDWASVRSLAVDTYLWADNGYEPRVEVRACWSGERLHILFRAYEDEATVRYSQMNDPVYKDSCVEFFVQPTPESDKRYLNFEFNAAGAMLLGLGINRDRELLSEVPPGLFDIRTAVRCMDATGNLYWTLECSIPFSFLRTRFPLFNPGPGTSMKGNFYKCGDETSFPHYGCWNPIRSAHPDFHRCDDFGILVLA